MAYFYEFSVAVNAAPFPGGVTGVDITQSIIADMQTKGVTPNPSKMNATGPTEVLVPQQGATCGPPPGAPLDPNIDVGKHFSWSMHGALPQGGCSIKVMPKACGNGNSYDLGNGHVLNIEVCNMDSTSGHTFTGEFYQRD